MHSLCQTCQHIFRPPSQKKAHHQSLAEFQESARNHCFVCSIVWNRILKEQLRITTDSANSEQGDQSTHLVSEAFYRTTSLPTLPALELEIWLRNLTGYEYDFGCRFGLQPLQGAIQMTRALIDLEVVPNKTDIDSELCLAKEDGRSTSVRPAFDMAHARAWLKDCLDQHKSCRLAPLGCSSSWPTRLLEIDRPSFNHVRLVSDTTALGVNIRYATLSHC